MTATGSAESTYRERRNTFAAEEARLGRISFRFSVLRGVLFLAFVACLFVVLLRAGRPGWEWWAGAGFWLVAFVAVLPYHERVVQRQRRVRDLRRINDEALHRLARSWAELPISSLPDPAEAERPISRDLGLFGRASLWHLLGTAHTPPGKITLSHWLLEPAAPEEIARRQGAVEELAPEVDLRQQLEVRARPMEKTPPDIETFLHWAEGEPWLAKRPWLLWLARGLAVLTIAMGVLVLATPLPASLFFLMVLINLAFSYVFREGTEGTFNRVEAREDQFQLYAEALALITERSYRSAELQHLLGDLTFQGKAAHRWMEVLHGRVGLADARHNAYLHFILQTILLWDFHILHLLERWQSEAGPHVRGWLAALGRFEALAALAVLRYDHPEWSFPSVEEGEDRLAAQNLGHPLIPDGRRVTNDEEVGPRGTFLLVTGSNMSGKSTLLRSIGVNAVLAQAGGPVCATALSMPPLTLATSILIEDSLEEGVSFFMAELQRIQRIVELSDRRHA